MSIKTTLIAATALIASTASFASAQGISAAQLQLASQAGVEAGQYSVAELHAIINANRGKGSATRESVATAFSEQHRAPVAANAQLSALAEVPEGTVTAGQAAYLAKVNRDPIHGDEVLAKRAAVAPNTQDANTAGWAQLAAQAGLTTDATQDEIIARLSQLNAAREQ